MRTFARIAVVTALAATPLLATTPAHACWDWQGRCLVNCVVDLATAGYCRL